MTQAHKTPGAIVVLSDWLENHHDWMRFADGSRFDSHIFEVIREEPRGHLHVRSVDNPSCTMDGWHDERFQTYHGPRLAEIRRAQRAREVASLRPPVPHSEAHNKHARA
jgi:hypothetical protein